MPQWATFDAFLEDSNRAKTDRERQMMVDELMSERSAWPWVDERRAIFVYNGSAAQSVALNLDTIHADPPFAPMSRIQGTTLWYVEQEFTSEDLLDYLIAVDDPMTPLAQERDIVGRIARHWMHDPLNPLRMNTAQATVSILRMPNARPFPDWASMRHVQRGSIEEHTITSDSLGFSGRKLWVYTPPEYEASARYPLLILQDGQWAVGPLQVPEMADALIKHERLQPLVIAMVQSGTQIERDQEYAANDAHYAFLKDELLPLVSQEYSIDQTNIGIGGVAIGAVAAAHAALMNPALFSSLMMISPPLGKSAYGDQVRQILTRFESAPVLPRRIFQSVGRYETAGRFLKPARQLHQLLSQKTGAAYRYAEVASGHGLTGFRGVLPEALAWSFPGAAFS